MTTLPAAGRYEVRFAYPANTNRNSKAQVQVQHAGGSDVVFVNERQTPAIDGLWTSLGTFDFTADVPATVTVTNADADGYTVIDAVQFLPVK
ncbi:MAG: hypothetical protein JNK76_26380 [Planctomycetales bacterium]|nr:hypothetical protein [Planctomycetales bacterium]